MSCTTQHQNLLATAFGSFCYDCGELTGPATPLANDGSATTEETGVRIEVGVAPIEGASVR